MAASRRSTRPARRCPVGPPGAVARARSGGAGRAGGRRASPYAVALRWTALDPGRTADAIFALNTATDWADFRAAAALFEVPAQNIVYADVDGNIGYQSPGKMPVRGQGRRPLAGARAGTRRTTGRGYIPFDRAADRVQPAPTAYIVTANQAVVGPQYQHLLTSDWTTATAASASST